MTGKGAPGGLFAPLRHAAFRRIWSASLFSNFGLLINGVGAGWAMTTMSGRAQDVALVQTALMLPYMLFSMAAGAIADTYDRRRVALVMLAFTLVASAALALTDWRGWLTPALLIASCFVIGTTNAMFAPSWQASVGEQVPAADLPSAVALNSVSYNIARSLGPAVGGAIVAAAGSVAAFAAMTFCYLPMVGAMVAWRRCADEPRLPPERIGWAIQSGVRYIVHSPPIRTVLLSCLTVGIAGGAVTSLMPLVSRDLLGGAAGTYGLLLGAFGVGAVLGAAMISRVRRRLAPGSALALNALIAGGAIGVVALSRLQPISLAALVVAGAAWMQLMTGFNVAIQTRAPRWVAGRALAGFQAAAAGGLALGSLLWGAIAAALGTGTAFGLSGAALAACCLLAKAWPAEAERAGPGDGAIASGDIAITLAITGRSGPIVVEVEHDVDPASARAFYAAMIEVKRIRHRNGAYGWSLSRDIADEKRWVERFTAPTWNDYLRQRDRMTQAEHAALSAAIEQGGGSGIVGVRRLLERPLGSVRWQAETPDRGLTLPVAAGTGP